MKKEATYKIIIVVLVIIVITLLVFILVSRPRKAQPPLVKLKGKIAIVIDDWGYSLKNVAIAERIKYPLTAAVLPNLPFSFKAAERLQKKGFEIILHLPMEPKEKYALEKGTIMASMDEQTIKRIMDNALSSVAYAKGVSNHQGSMATEDTRAMGIIFAELKKRDLFFLDSFVTSKSVCYSLARKMRIPFARRDIFLDNSENPAYIRQQLNKLKQRALLHGQAIGIGHDRKNTLAVISELMPEFVKEGYQFVFLSEIER